MPMTEDFWSKVVIGVVASVPSIIVATGGLLTVLKQGSKHATEAKLAVMSAKEAVTEAASGVAVAVSAAQSADIKADALLAKSDQIHDLTNSNLSLVKQRLSDALGRIDELEKFIRSQRQPMPPV